MKKEHSSYNEILKATSIFGGVQIINIVISIFRSKFIAIYLGPSGIGITALLNESLGLIKGLTSFGLSTSAVKSVAEAYSKEDEKVVAEVVAVLKFWVWLTGGIGCVLTMCFSPLLSELAFGNKEYTWAFLILSVTLFFNQISAGQSVIIQGTRQIKLLAISSLAGSLGGLIISLPLYYFLGKDGIVPAIFVTALTSLIITWFYSNKVNIPRIRVPSLTIKLEGKKMLKMGIVISLSGLLALFSGYILRVFISRMGDLTQVGLFNAGFAIINSYVGLIFTAMATDYYPRLSSVARIEKSRNLEINRQAEMGILFVSPIICIFLIFIDEIITALYSFQFVGISEMIYWAILGVFFKVISWSIGFIFLAMGASRIFFLNELISNSYLLIFNLLLYYFYGLEGLGVSFMIGYILHAIQMVVVSRKFFKFKLDSSLIVIIVVQFFVIICCFLTIQFISGAIAIVFGLILFLVSSFYSLYELNKRIGLRSILNSLYWKYFG